MIRLMHLHSEERKVRDSAEIVLQSVTEPSALLKYQVLTTIRSDEDGLSQGFAGSDGEYLPASRIASSM